MTSKVYLMVTEDYYGGEENTRIFTDLNKALYAVKQLINTTNGNLDIGLYEKDLSDPEYHKKIEFDTIPVLKRHTVSELIDYLEIINEQYADPNIEFWDQYEVSEIKDLKSITNYQNGMIYLGGFLHCSDSSYPLVCDDVDKGKFIYNKNENIGKETD